MAKSNNAAEGVNSMRSLFGRFATGVVVATTSGAEGHVAVTMNSFSTVSLTPPLISICLGQHLRSRRSFEDASRFCISILGVDQQDLSARCARAGEKDWDMIPHATSSHGIRYLQPAIAVLECEKRFVVQAGDHSIMIGEVHAWSEGELTEPLVFFNSRYSRIPAYSDQQPGV